MERIHLILGLVVISLFVIIPSVYGEVKTLQTDKQEFYVVGDTITFSGTSDPNDTIIITVYTPPTAYSEEGDRIIFLTDTATSTGTFSKPTEIQSSEFDVSGIYYAKAYSASQPESQAKTVYFDFSADGAPVSPSAYDAKLELRPIGNKTIAEGSTLTFPASAITSPGENKTLTFSLENNPPAGATIDSVTGKFSWTPTEAQGPGEYTFDVVVSDGTRSDKETITVTVSEVEDAPAPEPTPEPTPEPEPAPEPEPEPEPEPLVPDFVDPDKGAQYYLDRYNNEAAYKAWFDKKYPGYTIEQAIELAIPDAFKKTEPKIPDFVDPDKGAQYYLDRYNTEAAYKAWFDKKYPDYTIEQAIELAIPKDDVPVTVVFDFVDPDQNPQYYIDRYNNEPAYKKWFDKNYPDSTIYEAVGVSEPTKESGICGPGTKLQNGVCVVSKSSGGGCLIATAAFGTEMAPQVQLLREIRDNTVLQTQSGTSFMTGFNQFYYSFSPTIADLERDNPIFREVVKVGITPLLASLSVLNYVNIDSEVEMLGYGISLILLNVGMYIVAPTVLVMAIHQRRKKK